MKISTVLDEQIRQAILNKGETVKGELRTMEWQIKVGPQKGHTILITLINCESGAGFIYRHDNRELNSSTKIWADIDPQGTQSLKDDLGIQ